MLIDSSETKEKILTEFLKICTFDGWNKTTLENAVTNYGIQKNFTDIIFEKGCLEVAEFYIDSGNKKAAEIIAAIADFHSQKIRHKIRLMLYARFEVEKGNQIAVQRLINFYLDPKNFITTELGIRPALQSLRNCYKISDFIWKEINDQSTDFNFYTKRLTLSKIVLRSLKVFTQDDSENLAKTKNFIDSEIEKVMKFEQRKVQIKKIVSHTFINEKGTLKTPQEFIKDLPFFRLIKFR